MKRSLLWVAGCLVVGAVVLVQHAGWLAGADRYFYDWRVRHCQRFARRADRPVVFVDIDDGSLAAMGHWPWPRSLMAGAIDEIDRAGATVIGPDVMFIDAAKPRAVKEGETFVEIDDDAILEEAMRRSGKVVLAGDERSESMERVLPRFARVAKSVGFVDVLHEEDGVLRGLPIVRKEASGDWTMSCDLQLVCAAWKMGRERVTVGNDHVELRPEGREAVRLPVRWIERTGASYGVMATPLVGSTEWLPSNGVGSKEVRERHVPVAMVYGPVETSRRIAANDATMVRALRDGLGETEGELLKRIAEETDSKVRAGLLDRAMEEMKGFVSLFEGVDRESMSADERAMRDRLQEVMDAVKKLRSANERLESQLVLQRKRNKELFEGRVVMIGWVATGRTDFVTTGLHPTCPGVVVRGMMIDGIFGGEIWWVAPRWVDMAVTFGMGVLAWWLLLRRRGFAVLVWAGGLGVIYFCVNAWVIFDWGNCAVGMAGPLTVLGALAVVRLGGEQNQLFRGG